MAHNYGSYDPHSEIPLYPRIIYSNNAAPPMAHNLSQHSSSSYSSDGSYGYEPPQYSTSSYNSNEPCRYVNPAVLCNDSQHTYPHSQTHEQQATPPIEATAKKQKLYPCMWPGCAPKTRHGAFTRAADLERHMQTVHTEPKYLDCPYARKWCQRTGTQGFTRKDHLNEHIRQVHPGLPDVKLEKEKTGKR